MSSRLVASIGEVIDMEPPKDERVRLHSQHFNLFDLIDVDLLVIYAENRRLLLLPENFSFKPKQPYPYHLV